MNDVAPFYYVLIKIIIKSLFIYFYYYYFRRTTMMENRKAIFASVYTIITDAGCAVCVFTRTCLGIVVGRGGGYRWITRLNGFYFAATARCF